MKGNVYSISARVRFTQNLSGFGPFTPKDGGLYGLPLEIDTQKSPGLQAITVTNSLEQPFGHFQLVFAPQAVAPGGRSWDAAVLPYSLVTIALHRSGNDSACTDEPEVVMLGIVDNVAFSHSYESAQPMRSNVISGRSITAVLSDHRFWTHHWLQSADGKSNLPNPVSQYLIGADDQKLLRDEFSLRGLGFLAIDPRLQFLTNRDPVAVMAKLFDFFVRGTGVADPQLTSGLESLAGQSRATPAERQVPPFIKLQFADAVPISQRIRFDPEKAASSFVDPRGKLTDQFLASSLVNTSLWQAMRMQADQHTQELYSDTFGSFDGAYTEIIMRKRPFLGHIGYDSRGAGVAFSAKRPKLTGESLFDYKYGENWNKYADTEYIDGSDILGLQLRRDSGSAYTYYYVLPCSQAMGSSGEGDRLWRQEISPIIDEDPESPSFIGAYGVRPLEHRLIYIPISDASNQDQKRADGDIRRHAEAYAALLYEWNRRNPLMLGGTYRLKGRTALRVGKRLVDLSRRFELYIHTVHHSMVLTDQPSFTTTVGVSRGWHLEGALV